MWHELIAYLAAPKAHWWDSGVFFCERSYCMVGDRESQSVVHKFSPALTGPRRTAVLFFLLTVLVGGGRGEMSGTCCAGVVDTNDLHIFEFTCEFYVPTGWSRLDGLMLSQGSNMRIIIYWAEPFLFRESDTLLRYSDFLFTSEAVHYWIHGMAQPATLDWTEIHRGASLVQADSLESVVRCAICAASYMRSRDNKNTGIHPEMSGFLQAGRGHAQYVWEPVRNDDENELPADASSLWKAMNPQLCGWKYQKEMLNDNVLIWRARRSSSNRSAITVRMEPVACTSETTRATAFVVDSLGRGMLIPVPYRAYWSFDSAYSGLLAFQDSISASCELHDRIALYMEAEGADAPMPVYHALNHLRFRTALLTQDPKRVRCSAQAAVVDLCRDNGVNTYERLLEITGMSGHIERQYPQQAREWLQPLIKQTVKYTVPDVMRNIVELVRTIEANRWFICGRLLLEEIRNQGLENESAIDKMLYHLDTTCIAMSEEPPDPCEPYETVKRYTASLAGAPPMGTITMNDLRRMLLNGFPAERTRPSPGNAEIVEGVLQSIRRTVGEGPFCGDRSRLMESLDRFWARYSVANDSIEETSSLLATLLGLSFCDISTQEDHDTLLSQFQECAAEVQSQISTMLSARGLHTLATMEDVEGIFHLYEELFRRYVNDPLWPAFKFPWTRIERAKLLAKMRLRLMRLETRLEDVSGKVSYGGANEELRKMVIHDISLAAQQILPEAAFLHLPPYPGVSCHYRGGRGFTIRIQRPLYKEHERTKETFRAMKYFHLGHRLQDIVEREREFTRPSAESRDSQ